MPAAPDPAAEYKARLEKRRAAVAACDRQHIRLGNLRLLTGVGAAVLAWCAWVQGSISGWFLLIPIAVFISLVVRHEQVLREKLRRQRAVTFYERGIARIEDRWSGQGDTGMRFLTEDHPYAQDLDLFGNGSLFQLLSSARTRMGEETLAAWLLTPAAPDIVRERQAAVEELRTKLDLREDLALLGEQVGTGVHPEALSRWANGVPLLDSPTQRGLSRALPTVLAIVLGTWAVSGWADIWKHVFVAVSLVEIAFAVRLRARVLSSVHAVEEPAHDLALLQQILARLERERFTSPLLTRLRVALDTEGWSASHRIARLQRWIELVDSRDNVLLRLVGPPLLWTTQCAFGIEFWRSHSGRLVGGWLAAIGELEALASLAGYAYENPSDPFPDVVSGAPCFEGEALGHPLLPRKRMVPNDLRLGGGLSVLVVSGSNMSGKSTLLRTAGVNTVLALAGAPVRAGRLRLSPLEPCASIRVVDSLQGGKSRFYAEISRLRRFVDLTRESLPVFFLLDELLAGTNSHDRRIGAQAVVRELVERGAIGLITTHDLALAHIAEELGARGANVHFEDHLENGQITFDYRMRPGVVTKSNALELMRSMGLIE